MEKLLYIRIRGRVLGPYNEKRLRVLVRRGQLSRIHELSEDRVNWSRASNFAAIFSGDSHSTKTGKRLADDPWISPPMPQGNGPWAGISRMRSSWPQHAAVWIAAAAIVMPLLAVGAYYATVFVVGKKMYEHAPAIARNSGEEPDMSGKQPPSVPCDAVIDNTGEESTAAEETASSRDEKVLDIPSSENVAVGQSTTGQNDKAADIASNENVLAEQPASNQDDRPPSAPIPIAASGTESVQAVPETPANPKPVASGATISSVKEHGAIADAVGKVVVGGEVTDSEGKCYQVPRGVGSAFAISPNGGMLTNKHVIQDYLDLSRAEQQKIEIFRRMRVKVRERLWVFVNKEKYDAVILYCSPQYDFAILKLETHFKRPFAMKVSSEDLLDSSVRAVGFPDNATQGFSKEEMLKQFSQNNSLHADVADYFARRDFQYLLTSGTVSQVTQDDSLQATWLQHTATIAKGNSGGPLVSSDAVVLGVNTQFVGGSEEGGQFFRALCFGQFRNVIDRYVPGVTWIP